ncbi:hypothetical protein CsatA_018408 [Cannabis sativa]
MTSSDCNDHGRSSKRLLQTCSLSLPGMELVKCVLQGLKPTKIDIYGRLLLSDIIKSVNGQNVSSGKSTPPDFSFTIAKIVEAHISNAKGFKYTRLSAIDTQTFVTTKYIEVIAKSSASIAVASNRSQSNIFDIANALHDLEFHCGFSGASNLHRTNYCLLTSALLAELSHFVDSNVESPFFESTPCSAHSELAAAASRVFQMRLRFEQSSYERGGNVGELYRWKRNGKKLSHLIGRFGFTIPIASFSSLTFLRHSPFTQPLFRSVHATLYAFFTVNSRTETSLAFTARMDILSVLHHLLGFLSRLRRRCHRREN